jgi:hypothetical protein
MKTATLYTILLCVASAGFVAWRVRALRNNETPHFEIVEDTSASHSNGCESLLGLAEQALQSDGVAPGSTLTILVLGDQSTANEPWRMGTYPMPAIRKVLEGRSEISRRRVEILAELQNKCRLLRRTTISPIFLGVKQAVADLRAHGCNVSAHCRLFVDSDLEENVETSIEKRLNTGDSRKGILLAPLNNAGIEIVFCGFAVTHGRIHNSNGKETRKVVPRDSQRMDRVPEIWRSLFTQQAAVRFEPYCPKRSEFGAYISSRTSTKETPEP